MSIMKNTHLSYIIVASLCLASCAEDNVAGFDVEKSEEVVLAEQLAAYGTLLDYVSPSFKIGNTLDLSVFNEHGTATTLTTHNFNEITLSGVFSHAKLVNEDGVASAKLDDLDAAIRFAKEHNISVYGHSLLNGDVNSAYLNTKIVAEKNDVEVPMTTAETIELLGGDNFAEGMVPLGWRCDQDGEIHEYPNTYASGARTFEGFGGFQNKGVYWRVKTAEYGSQPDCPLTLTAGQYKLNFAMAAWKGAPKFKVEVLDASGNTIAESEVMDAAPNADGNKSADLSSATSGELPFTVNDDGNYIIRFTNSTEGFSEFLLMDCKVDVLKAADEAVYTNYLGGDNFAEGMVPQGWSCDQDGEIHEYPNTYASGARTFEGFGGFQNKGLYWRVKTAEYGSQPDCPLTLAPGQYKLAFAMAAWKGAPKFKVEILDASGNTVAASDVMDAAPNADGNKSADLSAATSGELPFTIDNNGNYIIRFTNSTEGFSEFLLLDCQVGAIKNNGGVIELKYSDETKKIAESEINNYVTTVVTDNPDIATWTVVENPASNKSVIWNKVLGSGYVTSAVKYARAANSSAKLFLSESGLEDADIRASFIDIVKASGVDGINVAVAVKEDTDLSSVFSDLAATGKTIRFNILSIADAASLNKALAAYNQVPESQRYGITFASTLGVWDENYNRTEGFRTLVDALK